MQLAACIPDRAGWDLEGWGLRLGRGGGTLMRSPAHTTGPIEV
jgi:hypothetical protein